MSTFFSTLFPNTRGMSGRGLWAAFFGGVLAISLISNVAAAPPQQKTSEKDAATRRPAIFAILNDGSTIEGVLDRFDKGVYSVRSAGKVYRFSEDDLKSISFQSRPLLLPNLHKDKSLQQLIEQFVRPRQSQDERPSGGVGGDPALVAPLAARGSRAIEPLIAEVNKNAHLYQTVAKIFHLMSPDVLPQLVEIYRKDTSFGCRLCVWYAMKLRGVASVPLLKEMMADPDPRIRYMAVDTLYSIGSQGGNTLPESLTPLLVKLLDDPDANVAKKVPSILARVREPVDKIVLALTKTLKGVKYSHIAVESIRGLAAIGSKLSADDIHLEQIISTLMKALDSHPSSSVRSSAAYRLGNLGPQARVAIKALQRATDSPDEFLRKYARESLYKLGTAPTYAVSRAGIRKQASVMLVTILAGEDRTAASAAGKELAIRKPDEKLFNALIEAVRADEKNRYWPSVAYLVAKWDQKTVLPALEKFARDEHHRVRRTATLAYGEMNLTSLPSGVRQLQKDSDASVRMTMTDSLVKLSKNARPEMLKQIVPLLIAGLKDETVYREYWRRAAAALGTIGPAHPDVVPALIDLMNHTQNPDYRGTAAETLGRLGSRLRRDHKDLDRIVAAMTKALSEESHPDVRGDIIYGLRYMGPRAKSALPALRKAEDDPVESISKAATKAIQAILKKKRSHTSPDQRPEDKPVR
ncbi:MAG: HEAT repeat domain-containing protein [Planctomycetes bacterium]|nr:HEAT repeat domain-containing protein [Planctomycetota bacterium]